jgi:hypothetical protein
MPKDTLHIEKYKPYKKPKAKIIAGDKTFETVIRNMASAGLEDKVIADFVGVKLKQLRKRMKQIPTLEAALVEGRSEATQQMVAQVYQVAMGGQITQKIKERINAKGEKSVEIMTEEHPPNPQMMMFWLTNTSPDVWKYSRQLIKEDTMGVNVDGKTLESDKIARLSREIFAEDTDGAEGKHTVSKAPAQSAGEGTLNERDLHPHVPGAADDYIQDNVLDVSTETGTVSVQTPAV